MIHFRVRHLMGVLKCHQLIAVPITTGKKKIQRLSVVTLFQLRQEKKKIQLSGHHSLRRSNCHCCAVPITTGKKQDTVVCPLSRGSKYDRKKKQKSGGCAIVITTGKKKF